VLHLDKNGKFINQWLGNNAGQGHFSMVHGIAVNPDNGPGQFVESSYMAMDTQGNLYTATPAWAGLRDWLRPRIDETGGALAGARLVALNLLQRC
jgi:hypothetical protein